MQKKSISFSQTGQFSRIITDYLNNENVLTPFYTWKQDISEFDAIIPDKAAEPIDRKLLTAELQQQYQGLTDNDLVNANILALQDENTFCVVTAHQLNIFGGPLYIVYKTLSVIKLCSTLSEKYPDKKFVPMFWLGSEDHDFEEINHVKVFGKNYTWNDGLKGATGQFNTAGISTVTNELFAAFGNGPFVDELKKIFTEAYLNNKTLADATRIILHSLFARFGLVVIDGAATAFKAACSEIILEELIHQTAEKIVNETLQNLPYPPQAKPRNINLFYLSDNVRERIVYNASNQVYEVVNSDIVFTEAALREEVKLYPERFSPNVILRPLFQQKILPAIAFIGGAGEIAYWLQLKNLFAHFNIQFPMLLQRDSFVLVDAATNKKLQKLQLDAIDFFADEQALIAGYVKNNSGQELSIEAEKKEMDAIFEGLLKKAVSIDSTLDKAVLAEKQAVLNAIAKLESKLLKAEKVKMEVQIGQITAIRAKLLPEGGMQERSENFISWYLKMGPAFIDTLLSFTEQPAQTVTLLVFEE